MKLNDSTPKADGTLALEMVADACLFLHPDESKSPAVLKVAGVSATPWHAACFVVNPVTRCSMLLAVFYGN